MAVARLADSVTNHPDVAAAFELLKPYQATLVEAARFYVKNSNLIRDPRKVEDVKAELLQSKGQDSRLARYLKDLGQKLSAFVDNFAGRPIHEITTPELDRWIRHKPEPLPLSDTYLSCLFHPAMQGDHLAPFFFLTTREFLRKD